MNNQAVGFVRSKGRALLHAYAEKEKGIRATRNTMNHAGDSAISREELEKRLQTFEQAARHSGGKWYPFFDEPILSARVGSTRACFTS